MSINNQASADQVYAMLGVVSSLFGASTKLPNAMTLFVGADAWVDGVRASKSPESMTSTVVKVFNGAVHALAGMSAFTGAFIAADAIFSNGCLNSASDEKLRRLATGLLISTIVPPTCRLIGKQISSLIETISN